MTTLSLAMIVRNEADRIANVLADASVCCDELIVVDTGSTDATMEIAESWDAKVFECEWRDDFAWARNETFSKCTSDWIIWLDADDHLPPESALIINRVMGRIPPIGLDAYTAEYRMINLAGDVTLRFDRERLIRREADLRWEGRVHETIAVGPAERSHRGDFWVEHRPGLKVSSDPRRNLRILEDMYANGDDSPRTLFYLANEYRDVGAKAMARAAYLRRLASDGGWAPETAQAAYELGKLLMGVANEEAEHWLCEAAEMTDYQRAEPLRQLQHLHETAGRSATARIIKAIADGLRPPPGGLFVEPWAYRP